MTTITRCTHCGEVFGTRAALSIHKPGNCRTTQTLRKAGAWQGFAGVWWTPDLGWDDATEETPFAPSQVIENIGRKLGKKGGLRQHTAPPIFTKFRRASA